MDLIQPLLAHTASIPTDMVYVFQQKYMCSVIVLQCNVFIFSKIFKLYLFVMVHNQFNIYLIFLVN